MNFSKETRFKDLPDFIKAKLISIYNKSQQNPIHKTSQISTPSFEEIYLKVGDLQTQYLEASFNKFIKASEVLKECNEKGFINSNQLLKNIKKELDEVSEKIFFYKKFMEQDEFLNDLKDTILVLSGRYLNLVNKYD
ncbi:hypothetical protein TCON_2524 [Astathelohania contejeani]|uniref:Uncharacterized protein n=1 Tax=Astathelohania contejeani TaxID=164912 RepID=A0ABQ7HVR9_9MICR|nr:hypothetical protein TCON_2524 [Thelohania contejeani]